MFRLLRSFTFTSVLALIIALGPLVWFQQDRANFHLRTVGEESNVALARLMATAVWPEFSDFLAAARKLDRAALRTQPEAAALDAEIRRLAQGLPVVQVKIFAVDGNTVYSTDPAQIGERLSDDAALRKAVGGGVSSELIERSSVSSLDGKRRSASLIASYVPVRAPDGRIAGVFEISSDVTALIDKLAQIDQNRPLQLAIMFGALWAALFLIVHVGDRVMRHQYTELSSMRDRVRAQADALEREVQQRAQAEREVLMLREVEISQRALHSLVKNLSHELRTPLNAIIGFSQLIATKSLDGPVPERTAEYAGHIETSAQHLLTLLNSILELAKAEAGELKLNENPVDVHVVADDCLRLFAPQAERAGVTLSNRIPDNPPPLLVDERLFREVLKHLLSNAIKFTPPNGSVPVDATLLADGAMRIEVVDTGAGIPQQQIPRVMAPFAHVNEDLDRDHQGTGLGLPVVKSLVELHGGSFRLESQVGQGTRAIAVFPSHRVQRLAA